MFNKPAKTHYTEIETAQELGVSVERLRTIIREHVMPTDDEIRPAAIATFQPSDVLLLKLLASQASAQAPQG